MTEHEPPLAAVKVLLAGGYNLRPGNARALVVHNQRRQWQTFGDKRRR
jgi:hypothetical protein